MKNNNKDNKNEQKKRTAKEISQENQEKIKKSEIQGSYSEEAMNRAVEVMKRAYFWKNEPE